MVRTWNLAREATTQEGLIETVWAYLLDFHTTHTINNACVCLASIVFANGDFDTAITTAVLFGTRH
ncbi:MAG: hypothetical protein MZU97_19860 [Bacillus subtilis]|nr:hypothetical protein [Bacillus subtilis]